MVESGNIAWDVVDVEGDYAAQAGKAGLLEPLDFTVIDKTKLDPRFVTDYSVGSFYYSFVIGCNKDAVGECPKTWADLFDTEKFPGKRTFYKWSAPGVIEAALLADGVAPASPIGELRVIAYATPFDSVRHFAFVYGDINSAQVVPVRLHRSDIVGDILGGAASLHAALERIRDAGAGLIVYLRDGAAGVPLKQKEGTEQARQKRWLDVGLGAQILRDLGATRIRILASRELNYVGLRGFGIEIESNESML